MLTKTGVVVGVFPFDHVGWMAPFARQETAIWDDIVTMPGISGKELWITGTIDPLARRVLEGKGWKMEDSIQDRLLKKLEP